MNNLDLFYNEKVTLKIADMKAYYDILDILTLRGVKCCGKHPHHYDELIIDNSILFLNIFDGCLGITTESEYDSVDSKDKSKAKRYVLELWENEF